MKKLSFYLMALLMGATVALTSCGDDDEGDNPGTTVTEGTVEISDDITSNVTWTSNNIYIINGRVAVTDGVTLTIQPGTIIKGAEGEGLQASVLMVARGGKIQAVGTADNPIIMTSVLDGIKQGEKESTLNQTNRGLWGGLVILGKAPISASAGAENQIEGTPASYALGLYGGDDENDNSGTLAYVSIRYGGAVIDATEGDEINGLTLGGVGAGTSISFVEVYSNIDDGIEFFGGSVSVTNALVSFQGDDAIDVDQAWSGTLSNFWVFADSTGDEALEIDGPEDAVNSTGKFTIQNGTCTSVAGGSLADFKSNAQGTVNNVLWSGYGSDALAIRASYNSDCSQDGDALLNLLNDDLVFTSAQFGTVSVYSEDDCATELAADQTAAEGKAVSAAATGAADASIWTGWTQSNLSGVF